MVSDWEKPFFPSPCQQVALTWQVLSIAILILHFPGSFNSVTTVDVQVHLEVVLTFWLEQTFKKSLLQIVALDKIIICLERWEISKFLNVSWMLIMCGWPTATILACELSIGFCSPLVRGYCNLASILFWLPCCRHWPRTSCMMMSLYKHALTSRNVASSAVVEHAADTGHTINREVAKIIDSHPHWKQWDIVGSLTYSVVSPYSQQRAKIFWHWFPVTHANLLTVLGCFCDPFSVTVVSTIE